MFDIASIEQEIASYVAQRLHHQEMYLRFDGAIQVLQSKLGMLKAALDKVDTAAGDPPAAESAPVEAPATPA